MKNGISISALFVLIACVAYGQQRNTFNLAELATLQKLQTVHRSIQVLDEAGYKGVRLSEEGNEGLVWVKDMVFSNGTIQLDVRGKDELQRSFIGIAIHGQNDSTFDAVYFRPFNFHAKDSVRRIHAVQYVSHPVYTWKKLRDDKTTNAQFEKEISNAPDPNGWFHIKILVKDKIVKVFVNDRQDPVLMVQQLSNFSSGKIGLFMGDGSGGDFANLIIE